MSTCSYCDREIHPFDASHGEACHTCRQRLGLNYNAQYRPRSIYDKGSEAVGRPRAVFPSELFDSVNVEKE